MNKERWLVLSSRGAFYHIVVRGYFKIGLAAGFVGLTLQYWYDISRSQSQLSFNGYFYEYLTGVPYFALIGVLYSLFAWVRFNIKFGIKETSAGGSDV